MTSRSSHSYSDVQAVLDAANSAVIETEVALDLGCGIVPMNYFRPKLHIMVEPWEEYSNILNQRHSNDKSVLVLRLGALEALKALSDRSVDSIFLLDVIEHLTKDVGLSLIVEMERVARRQVVIFTPLGFMPQHMDAGEVDAWGLGGGEMQEHKSGWLPEDFGDAWEFHICETYHSKNFRGEVLDKPYGAFFAILNINEKIVHQTNSLSDIRRPLPSEVALERLQSTLSDIVNEKTALVDERTNLLKEKQYLSDQLATVTLALDEIRNSRSYSLLSAVSRLFPQRRK